MKKLYLILLITGSISQAMELPSHQIDANGYRYRDESSIQDARKIAILSYGSLVNQRENQQTGARLEIRGNFQPTSISLPVSLSRRSNGPRITAVIDREGEPKRVWAAISVFGYLPNARNNVAAREGAQLRSQEQGYDLSNVSYMKRLMPGRNRDNNEEAIAGTNWAIRTEDARKKLPANIAKSIVDWAENNGFSAVIWASYPSNLGSKAEVIKLLVSDDALLRNTQAYVQNLPDGPQTDFERAVMAGKDALLRLIHGVPLQQVPVRPKQPQLVGRYNEVTEFLPALSNEQLQTLQVLWQNLAARAGFTLSRGRNEFIWFHSGLENAPIDSYEKENLENYYQVKNEIKAYQSALGWLPEIQQKRFKDLEKNLVGRYKIHLMPSPQTNPTQLLSLILEAYTNDPELKQLIPFFKIAPHLLPLFHGQILPQVVMYIDNGTQAAQKALNKLFAFFNRHPEIKGSGITPRFNMPVNDLIYFAQGDGDFKGDQYKEAYELPAQIYYRSDFTGVRQNYHLRHPETGQELIDPNLRQNRFPIAQRPMIEPNIAIRPAVQPAAPKAPAAPQAAPRVQLPAANYERLKEKFTYFQKGDLPILLTAPHGGQARIPEIPNRVGLRMDRTIIPRGQFVTVWDDMTLELAMEVSDNIYAILGQRPYLVAADFIRTQIDANRSARDAYEVPAAQQYYDFYHNKIAQYIQEIRKNFGDRAILIDIHGQGTDARTVFRGTRDRVTVNRLINRDGEQAFTGPDSILGILESKGNIIFPRNGDRRTNENRNYSGGYTVGRYGSHNANGIDALQLENGYVIRRAERARFARDLAEAIVHFYIGYLAQ